MRDHVGRKIERKILMRVLVNGRFSTIECAK
jgi:hypothetical protein